MRSPPRRVFRAEPGTLARLRRTPNTLLCHHAVPGPATRPRSHHPSPQAYLEAEGELRQKTLLFGKLS